MKLLILSLVTAALAAVTAGQTFTGTITDSRCADADHSEMRMGPTDAECAVACIESHAASYVLYDGKDTYALSDQRAPEKLVAQRVKVTGTLDAKSKLIQAESITAAE
jgi:hypothetical protein